MAQSVSGIPLNYLRWFVLGAGALMTFWLLFFGTSWPPVLMFHGSPWLVAWVLSPYVTLAVGRLPDEPRVARRILLGASVIVTGLGVTVYLDAFLGVTDAQGPLVFLSIPALQLVAAIAAHGAAWAAVYRHRQRIKNTNNNS